MDMQKQTMRYLKDQCARYPALETQDLLKAPHQSVYGCGHFVSDAAADLLEQELASLRPDASVDAEPLDGSFCRLHLGYLRSSGLSSATLLRMFILSAAGPVGSEAQLREKLSALLAAFADAGANILTVNQNIPAGGVASVSISARTDRLAMPVDGFVRTLGALPGVERITRLTGEGITGMRLDMPGA